MRGRAGRAAVRRRAGKAGGEERWRPGDQPPQDPPGRGVSLCGECCEGGREAGKRDVKRAEGRPRGLAGRHRYCLVASEGSVRKVQD